MLFAPGGSQADKDRVWGPYSYKFQILVKVSSGQGRCCWGLYTNSAAPVVACSAPSVVILHVDK